MPRYVARVGLNLYQPGDFTGFTWDRGRRIEPGEDVPPEDVANSPWLLEAAPPRGACVIEVPDDWTPDQAETEILHGCPVLSWDGARTMEAAVPTPRRKVRTR